MRLTWNFCAWIAALVVILGFATTVFADDTSKTGPKTEQRFPPLKVPPGFKATLFACDPLVEYPSVISLGPKSGTIYVAYDYMTGLGVEIVRRDEVRLVEDTDGDGYADKSALYARDFNSIQGLAYQDGSVYVMHAPLLTSLRDTDGDGRADERRDLLSGLGLPPEKNNSRLHCANGVVVGHDGWLYLALGDNSCDVRRPEGDRFLFQEGGILRCRPDGTDLHVFAGGLRNIYDIAVDEELNVFVRDNENDGGDYMIRVCHSFHGADHGYPYLYYERPGEAMLPLADLGRGSSAGGVCYLETSFPAAYRGNLFFCEWGRSVVRYERQRAGSTFAQMTEHEFAAGAETDPYGFKPTDAIVDYDGSLVISDWCDGQRPKRGRARIYRISHSHGDGNTRGAVPPSKPGIGELVRQLNSESYHTRVKAQLAIQKARGAGLAALRTALKQKQLSRLGRLHAIWILSRVAGSETIDELFAIAGRDDDPSVRAQAVRALADLTDPILVQHRLDAGRGDSKIAARMAMLPNSHDPRVQLEIAIGLRRLRWQPATEWLRETMNPTDPALSHAAQQLLRGADNWKAVLALLDEPTNSRARNAATRALARQANSVIADDLMRRLEVQENSRHRREYADLLTRIYKKPVAWTYWGYRPPPRPANSVEWDRTKAVASALDRVLAISDNSVRTATLLQMQREQVPVRLATLTKWLKGETNSESLSAILISLKEFPASEVQSLLNAMVTSKQSPAENRLAALQLLIQGLDRSNEKRIRDLSEKLEDGAVLAFALRELGRRPAVDSKSLLIRKVKSKIGEVRASSIESLARLKTDGVAELIVPALSDPDPQVRRAAAMAVGLLQLGSARDQVVKMATDPHHEIRAACLTTLVQLDDSRAVTAAVKSLENSSSQLAALDYLSKFGGPKQIDPIVKLVSTSRSNEVLARVSRALARWETGGETNQIGVQRVRSTIAVVQGMTGLATNWQISEPVQRDASSKFVEIIITARDPVNAKSITWSQAVASKADGIVDVPDLKKIPRNAFRFAVTEIFVEDATQATIMASSEGPLKVWINAVDPVLSRKQSQRFRVDSDRFLGQLTKGRNRIVVQLDASAKNSRFHLRFRRQSFSKKKERLAQSALARRGNAGRGRDVFLNKEKTLCMKCHRLGKEGARIGPDLSGVGARFSRIHLIESILEPSRAVAPSYETRSVVLESGLVVTGVKITESESTLTIGDNQGKVHEIKKSGIEETRIQKTSTMPDDMEKRVTEREFVDLIEYLLSLRAANRN